jgi:hypothetical protein
MPPYTFLSFSLAHQTSPRTVHKYKSIRQCTALQSGKLLKPFDPAAAGCALCQRNITSKRKVRTDDVLVTGARVKAWCRLIHSEASLSHGMLLM